MTSTKDTSLATLPVRTRSLLEQITALAECYPTDSDQAPLILLRAIVAGKNVGSAPLMPTHVDWLRKLVTDELATTREAHPGGSGMCGHCKGTGTSGSSPDSAAAEAITTVYVAEVISWDGNAVDGREHIAARTSLGSALDALREHPDHGGDFVATEVDAREYFRDGRAWAVHQRGTKPTFADVDEPLRVIIEQDVHQ